jgi:ACR3 family arsenite transporter
MGGLETGVVMTSVSEISRRRTAPALGTFERYLTVWVALCIVAGIVLGRLLPSPFHALGRMTVAEVNIPVAVLIWLMIVPMLLKVDFGALHRVAEQWRGIAVTVGINWLVKPFSMALLGWLFIGWIFRPWLPAGQIDSYIAGLILLAAAPCTAMVFVWSNLTNGEPNFTLTQVALNDTIMVFAFAPIVGLLLGLSSITVPWTTLFLSVVLYIVVPVIAAQLWRRSLLVSGGDTALAQTLRRLQPILLLALLATLVLLFGFQGEQIVNQPLIIALLAVPIVIQVYLNAGIAYGLNRALGVPHNVACPSALIGASNFFDSLASSRARHLRPSSVSWSKCRSCSRSCASSCGRKGGTSIARVTKCRGAAWGETQHCRCDARNNADAGVGIELLLAGNPGAADRHRAWPVASHSFRGVFGIVAVGGGSRAGSRSSNRQKRRPRGSGAVQSRAWGRFDSTCALAGRRRTGGGLGGARRRNGVRSLRLGLCHPDRSLRAGGSRPDHRNHADRRVRHHHWMAALGGARCEPGLARRLPDLGGNQSADRAAAQPLSHSTRTAARTPSRAGYRGGNGAAGCDADPGFCFRRDLVCDRSDGGAHAAPS